MDLRIPGVKAWFVQGPNEQMMFTECTEEATLPEHAHAAQWGIVVEGRFDLTVDGVTRTYTRGDYYFIPAGTRHSARMYPVYADVTFFAEKDRYSSSRGD